MAKRPNKKPRPVEKIACFGSLAKGAKFMIPWLNKDKARLYYKVNSALAKQVGEPGEYKSMLVGEDVIRV